MLVIPAIDIIDGECVRLTRGDFNLRKIYSDNPVETALKWKEAGAEWLHIVDLDGARCGKPANLKTAEDIKLKTGLKIQYGGGIRDSGSFMMVMEKEIDRAIVGTRAIEDKDFLKYLTGGYSDRFIVSLDFDSKGTIYRNGWQSATALSIFDFISSLSEYGIKEVIITNISRDGTLEGIDLQIIEKILDVSKLRLVVAGGISSIDDIKKLKTLENRGISGVIIGKALYEGSIILAEAIKTGI